MACIRLNYKRVTDGKNVWHVTGTLLPGDVAAITQVYGDVTDIAGLSAAMQALIASRPRYNRVLKSTPR